MTTATQLAPTDAEIAALRSEFGITSNGRGIKEFTQVREFARAVLAKWGTPAVAGKPVAWLSPWRADQVTTDYDAYGEHGIPLYTAPKPVEREPLTDEWIRSRCKEPWVFETAKQWVRMAEAAHGINKGGQHGTE